MDITLASLTHLLDDEGLLAHSSCDPTPVSGVTFDSRDVTPGDLFVCKGVAFRPAFLEAALSAGAVGYLADESHAAELAALAPDVPALVAHDDTLRPAMADAAAEVYRHPDRDVRVVGITGTKGKSTVAYLLRGILDGDDPYSTCGITGSIETFDGLERFESRNTTPEAPEVFRHIAHARDAHLPFMLMEISSQGLKYDRVRGLSLEVGAFLNIGRDHISPVEHPTFEDYFASKLRIFSQSEVGIVNLGCDHLDRVLAAAGACERVMTFSVDAPGPVCGTAPDVWATDVHPSLGFISFTAHTPSWTSQVILGMGGLFNVENALAAIAICEVLGIGQQRVREGLSRAKVPGRMELVESGDGQCVGVVDFAHNEMSFEKFFTSIKQEYPARSVVGVFGAPGNKAEERRTQLPAVASHYCDHIVYTEDDPAREAPSDICAQLVAATPAGQSYEVVLDRTDAIRRAVDIARAGRAAGQEAVVCVLAKGNDDWIKRGTTFEPMVPDAEVLLKALRSTESL
ncbi:MAG: UDP-N-acetylmuramoyl-L-alanyl-D-glutamate--2,6-diaminopimelate ligase [Atopobiaceae bacterium]|jgi:UDP-N-acetylmuramoyl-L-alanyl-D-glutamate--2,6-diaminopimelate ligase|nr:UDP-N-acetylmuramoyl-L-alanyl-D-glutamate--2,6-diaminopimelate ligase [Atopobiaceae bacterium]MCH4180664.1 UDP-N-acetylmuramoyl-L-alanyl-D-glutamate--2,6-diaminopimelate ligase [Atopobiaceae bacterium]MCH4214681.1 UDP-N-acetylmuramoyl-L-alanyl-D-glutamate--2,6-diaminopimelate ligase [Atopobiaceae bacterium]MCH4229913.1 UDP-N-acetylmuramoyl-L-alanyl-D-glutamate--2,6-diaminopimelate ligase [Atopobiaceae bacterium]MCH4276727.1 UDP-N-acetylmuramoyl-L-alanyl-D-glutamate--2,6-diaminopimelate ligas